MQTSSPNEEEGLTEFSKLKEAYEVSDSLVEKLLIKKLIDGYIQGSYEVYPKDTKFISTTPQGTTEGVSFSSSVSTLKDKKSKPNRKLVSKNSNNNNSSEIKPSISCHSKSNLQWRPRYRSKIEPSSKTLGLRNKVQSIDRNGVKTNMLSDNFNSLNFRHAFADVLPSNMLDTMQSSKNNSSEKLNTQNIFLKSNQSVQNKTVSNGDKISPTNSSFIEHSEENSPNPQKRSYEDISSSLKKCLSNLNSLSSSLTDVVKKENKTKQAHAKPITNSLNRSLPTRLNYQSLGEQNFLTMDKISSENELKKQQKFWNNQVNDIQENRIQSYHKRNWTTQSATFDPRESRSQIEWKNWMKENALTDHRLEKRRQRNFNFMSKPHDYNSFSDLGYVKNLNSSMSLKPSKLNGENYLTSNLENLLNVSEFKNLNPCVHNNFPINMNKREKVIEAKNSVGVISCSPTSSCEYLNDSNICCTSETDREEYNFNNASSEDEDGELSETSINQFTQYARYIDELKHQSNLMLNILSKKNSETVSADNDLPGNECLKLLIHSKTKTSNLIESIENYLLSRNADKPDLR